MKRSLLFFLATSISLVSCHSPSYTFNRSSDTKIIFPEGEYLLNTIQAPEAVRLDMQEMIFDDFTEYIGAHKLTTLQDAPVSIFPSEITLRPEKKIIQHLDDSTRDFDFLINIKTEVLSDDVGGIQIGNLADSDKNTVNVGIEILDLNKHTSIYFSQVRAHLSTRNDTKDLAFAADTNTMLKKSLKKILRQINRNNN